MSARLTGAPEESRLERVLLPLLHEPTLLPIWIVVVGHAAAFLAPILLLALRDRGLPAAAALVLVVGLSFAGVRRELRRRGRPGAVSAWIGVTWLVTGVFAWAADRYGLF